MGKVDDSINDGGIDKLSDDDFDNEGTQFIRFSDMPLHSWQHFHGITNQVVNYVS